MLKESKDAEKELVWGQEGRGFCKKEADQEASRCNALPASLGGLSSGDVLTASRLHWFINLVKVQAVTNTAVLPEIDPLSALSGRQDSCLEASQVIEQAPPPCWPSDHSSDTWTLRVGRNTESPALIQRSLKHTNIVLRSIWSTSYCN